MRGSVARPSVKSLTATDDGAPLGSNTLSRVMLGVGAVVTVGVLPVFLVGGLAVQLGQDLDLSPSGIGLAGSLFFAVGALTARPLAGLTERIGPTPALRLAAGGSAVCLALMAAVPSGAWLIVVLCCAGVPTALSQPAANEALMSSVDPSRRGFGFAVKQSAIPAATLVSGLAVPVVALTLGWRWAFGMAAVLAVLAVVMVPTVRSAHAGSSRNGPGGLGRAKAAPVLIALAVVAGLASAAANAMGTFVTISAVDVGYAESTAGLLLAVGSAAGLAARLGAGWLADRHRLDLLAMVCVMMALGAVGFGMLAIAHRGTFLVGLILGFAAGWAWPGVFNYAVASRFPDRVAAATAVSQTGVYVGASLGPVLFGLAAEHRDPALGWVAAAGCLVVSTVVLTFVRVRDAESVRSVGSPVRPLAP